MATIYHQANACHVIATAQRARELQLLVRAALLDGIWSEPPAIQAVLLLFIPQLLVASLIVTLPVQANMFIGMGLVEQRVIMLQMLLGVIRFMQLQRAHS